MRARALLGLLLLLLAGGGAMRASLAQTAGVAVPGSPAPGSGEAGSARQGDVPVAAQCVVDGRYVDARRLFEETVETPRTRSIQVAASLTDSRQRTAEAVTILLSPPAQSDVPWGQVQFIGATRSRALGNGGRDYRPVDVKLVSRDGAPAHAGQVVLTAGLPTLQPQPDAAAGPTGRGRTVGGAAGEWEFLVAACDQTGALRAHARLDVLVGSARAGWAWAIGVTVLIWVLSALAAWLIHAERLQGAWEKHAEARQIPGEDVPFGDLRLRAALGGAGRTLPRLAWKASQALNPVFICQDALGCGSLVRFQLYLFSVIVACVTTYIFVRAGYLTNYSPDILLLLGITGLSGALARLAPQGAQMTPPLRRLLFGLRNSNSGEDKSIGFLKRASSMPMFSDFVRGDGELEITRVQALIFTVITAGWIVASAGSGLGSFDLPDEVIYLLGLSQGIYLLGRVLPADTDRKMREDLEAVVKAAADVGKGAVPEDTFTTARDLASVTLRQIYGELFRQEDFDRLTPGEVRRAAGVPG